MRAMMSSTQDHAPLWWAPSTLEPAERALAEARAILEETEPEVWERLDDCGPNPTKATWHERIHADDPHHVPSRWALAESLTAVIPVLEQMEREAQ